MPRRRVLLAGALIMLSFAAMSAWHSMPIYPDEIAFRLQLGRYIQDQGIVHGLYPLCASNIKETPFLFIIPAWILSYLDLAFSPVAMRVLPFMAVMAAMSLSIWYAVRGGAPQAAVVATTAFIGVAGSGLVLARYEYVQVLNIVFCLGVFHLLQMTYPRPSLHYGLFLMLLLSSLLSIYAHVQGLLFLPLTLYLAFYLLRPGLGKPRAALLMIMLLVIVSQSAIKFHHATCAGYPGIEQFWAHMTFNIDEFKMVGMAEWLSNKVNKYLSSFLYVRNYAVNYLPGIDLGGGARQDFLTMINQCIRIVLLLNLLLFISITFRTIFQAVKQYSPHNLLGMNWTTDREGRLGAVPLVLLFSPVIFLFGYDSVQNFYRSFFLNFIIAIVLSLYFSRNLLGRKRFLFSLYFFLCGLAVVMSLAINVWWFTGRLHAGYEGPSISLNRKWDIIDNDVKLLVKDCDVDLSKGGIVLDDVSYASLKSYPRLYAATYMGLSAGLANISISDVIEKVHPNYAIAQCGILHAISMEPQGTRNQLCCVNLLNVESSE